MVEYLQGVLTLTLSAVGVDRGARQTLVVEEVVNHVALALAVNEDERTRWLTREDQVEQGLVFLVLINIDNGLLDV